MEFALVMPLMVVIVLGVVETGYALLHQHVALRLTREGSNLISRSTTLADAATAMTAMTSPPVNLGTNTRVIFSVIKRVGTVGASNYNKDVLYQRYSFGSIAATSALATRGGGSFGGAPDYQAANSDSDTSLQVTNLPGNLLVTGGMLYVTEMYTTHQLITPLARFGVNIPTRLYSISYF
ncbi:MAG TPA: TadE family protein [Vicinamibacterales bacterium]|nr:TadE family protein [Vicinamibacterales bacterium]